MSVREVFLRHINVSYLGDVVHMHCDKDSFRLRSVEYLYGAYLIRTVLRPTGAHGDWQALHQSIVLMKL